MGGVLRADRNRENETSSSQSRLKGWMEDEREWVRHSKEEDYC